MKKNVVVIPLVVTVLTTACASVPIRQVTLAGDRMEGQATWESRLPGDVRVVQLGSTSASDPVSGQLAYVPLVVAGTDETLHGLDAETGETLWTRTDIGLNAEKGIALLAGGRLALIERDDRDHRLLSMDDGRTLWTTAELPLKDVHAYQILPGDSVVLVIGKDSEGEHVLTGVRLEDGALLWIQHVWSHEPASRRDTRRVTRHATYEPPLLIDDSVVVLWPTKDGPTALNPITGEVVWRARQLADRDPPHIGRDRIWAAWQLYGGRIYAPYENRLVVLQAASGETIWDVELTDGVGRMLFLDTAIVVQGWHGDRSYVDLRNRQTGLPLWDEARRGLTNASEFILLRDEELLLIEGNDVVAISLADGARRELSTLEFKGGERPVMTWRLGDRALAASEQNFAILSAAGEVVRQAYEPRPDKELIRQLTNVASILSFASLTYQMVQSYRMEMNYGLSDPQLERQRVERLQDRRGLALSSFTHSQAFVRTLHSRLALRMGATNYAPNRAIFLTKRRFVQDQHDDGEELWALVQHDFEDGAEDVAWTIPLAEKPQGVVFDGGPGHVITWYENLLEAFAP